MTANYISIERQQSAITLRLACGVMNALTPELIIELAEAIK